MGEDTVEAFEGHSKKFSFTLREIKTYYMVQSREA